MGEIHLTALKAAGAVHRDGIWGGEAALSAAVSAAVSADSVLAENDVRALPDKSEFRMTLFCAQKTRYFLMGVLLYWE